MREKKHGKLEPGREGLNLANLLRESLVCAVVVIDSKQRLNLLAGGTEEILGLKQQRARHSINDLPEPLQKLAREAMASGQGALDREIKLTIPRKGVHHLEVSAVPLRPGAKNGGFALVIRNLTSPKWLEHASSLQLSTMFFQREWGFHLRPTFEHLGTLLLPTDDNFKL